MVIQKAKNAKRNMIMGLFNKVVTMLLPFLLRSIIIQFFGAEYLGLNSLFTSILQVLNLTELGFSNAIVYSMYRPIAENDHTLVCALLNYFKKMYRNIGLIVFAFGLLLIPFLKYLINGSYPNTINIYILYLLYLINTVISYILYGYKTAIINAHQRVDLISLINTISLGTMYILQIVVLIKSKNYYLYAMLLPIFTVVQNMVVSYVSKKKFSDYYCAGQLNQEKIHEIRKNITGLMISKVCVATRNSLDNIFVSAFLGLTITAIYGNYYYIMNAVIAILMVISDGLLAGIGHSIVTDSISSNYQTFRKINFLYMWIVGWCSITMCCLFQPFMLLWVGNNLMFNFDIMLSICIYFYVLEMGVVRGLYSDAAGLWWENRFRALGEAVANIVLNYLLVRKIGVIGIVSATTISLLIINFGMGSQIVFKNYFKNGKTVAYFLSQLEYMIVTIAIGTACYLLLNLVTIQGIKGLILRIILLLFVPNLLYLLVYRWFNIYDVSVRWLINSFKFPPIFQKILIKNHDEGKGQ